MSGLTLNKKSATIKDKKTILSSKVTKLSEYNPKDNEGRPTKYGNALSKKFSFTCTPLQLTKIDQKASSLNMTRLDFIRMIIAEGVEGFFEE